MEGAQHIERQEPTAAWGPERAALLGLWAIPGVGPRTLERIAAEIAPPVQLLDVPCREWANTLSLTVPVRERLDQVESLREVSEIVRERAARAGIRIAFPGDADFPENLSGLPDMPPLLFVLGERSPGRRKRVATVGARRTDAGFAKRAQGFAADLARAGLGLVSGAAPGTDTFCHEGALAGGGESWAFVGSALDQLDPHQARVAGLILGRGGVFFSELPPGVRARPEHFPRRNRLISGASDAVLVMRAKMKSGSLITADLGLKQGRPVLALPGEFDLTVAQGANDLIRRGDARMCLGIEDVLSAVGLRPETVGRPRVEVSELDEPLSEPASAVLEALGEVPRSFEEVLGACGLGSGAVTSALCELELLGLVEQLPGKIYERV